ncbi:YqeG family HAD IIIA-type phosphatase ['Camptotheca acuminata' phytoplasma]|uniref:YqeG family HAD IIIA-type phosphatase n=1 Tax='Camptotheca acuminata' phytoplasma TaxID=3239192 RepID=UPI00351A819E
MINKYKYSPSFYYESIFDIPYDFFYNQKKIKALFFDLDNTLLRPEEKKLNDATQIILKKLSLKFQIVIISNASFKKLKNIISMEYLNYIYLNFFRKKPSHWGLQKALTSFNLNHDEVVMIGDQLRTDILSANKMNILSILVKPLDKEKESLITKLSRYFIEKRFISKIKKIDSQEYNRKFKNFL